MKSTKLLFVVLSILMLVGIASTSRAIDPLKLSDIPKAAEEMVNPVDYRDAPDTAKYIVRLSHGIYSRWWSQNVLCERFGELMSVYTNNRAKLKIFPASQLGSEQETVQAIRIGGHEMTLPATNNLAPYAPAVGYYVLPYLIASDEEMAAVQDETTDWLNKKVIQQAGVRILGWEVTGWRYLFNSKKEIKSPDDLKGLKMRVPKNAMMIDTYKAWGVTPIPVAWSEMYNALQQKVVDGGDNPITDIVGRKFHEITPYVTTIHYMDLTHPLLISEKYFQSLPKDIQNAMIRAGKEATAYIRWWAKIGEDKIWVAKAKKEGVIFTEPVDELGTWMARAKTIWPKYYNEVGGKEVIDRVLKIVERVRAEKKK